MNLDHVARNLENVRRRIAAAARRAGRDPGDVALVAVTKTRSDDEVRALVEAGQRVLAENRPQELTARAARLAAEGSLTWHLIGHLQTNKVKQVLGRCALIHGVDSVHLLEALERGAEGAGLRCVEVLLEVNVSGEASKFGFAPEAGDAKSGRTPGAGRASGAADAAGGSAETAGDALATLATLERVRCIGLMTMAPWEARPEDTRPVFRGLRELRDRLARTGARNFEPRHLSMGMTNDFEVAVEEGATLVRVGTALFERPEAPIS